MAWKDWSGYYAVRSYDTCHEPEYFALRHSAGLIDVSPLFKYEVRGPDAADFLARILVRDVRKLKPGRVSYLCWCNDDGKVLDDGTIARLDEDHFRLTANGPSLHWLAGHTGAARVSIEDSSERLGVLALQGPRSRDILVHALDGDLEKLRFFRITTAAMNGIQLHVSRTGYTGDLGYEIWMERGDALKVWDAIVESGRPHRLRPAGLDAMDVTRMEAGFILNGVDYFSAQTCLIESRKSSPFEIGLGWTVHLEREPFLGQKALRAEVARGSTWALVGLEYDWDEYESLFDEFGLPPQMPGSAWRDAVPVFDEGRRQVGQATSGAWSPLLKKNLALATVRSEYRDPGTRLRVEVTVEFQRRHVSALVTATPFFNPERKRA